MSTFGRPSGHRLVTIVTLAVPIFIGACSIQSSLDYRANDGRKRAVCTAPRQLAEDQTNLRYAALRNAPYLACQGYLQGDISRSEYLDFLADYPALILLSAVSESLERLEPDKASTLNKQSLDSRVTDNAALKIICKHQDLFEVESECANLLDNL